MFKNKTKEKSSEQKSELLMRIIKYATAVIVVLVLFWFGFTTVVREGHCAVILRLGAVRQEITDAGLYFKLPWPFETVKTYDARLQCLESDKHHVLGWHKNRPYQGLRLWPHRRQGSRH